MRFGIMGLLALVTAVSPIDTAKAQDLSPPEDVIAAIEGRWVGASDTYEVEIKSGVVTLTKTGKNGFPRLPIGTVMARLNNNGERDSRTFYFTGSQCYEYAFQQNPYFRPCLRITQLGMFVNSMSLSVATLALRRDRNMGTKTAAPQRDPVKRPSPVDEPSTAQAKPAAPAELVETASGPILMSPQKKAEYEAKLAEHQRQLAERERAIADAAARHAANKAAAEAQVAQHNKELAEHRERVAQMERDAAAVRAEWAQRAAGADAATRDEERVAFKEGVVLCNQPNPAVASFSCKGPLQNVSTRLDVPEATVALGQACGSDRSIRDLGMVKGFRAFGCGFGIHPTARDYPGNTDVPAQLGVDFVPGRGAYFCPKSKLAYCRG